MAASLSAAVSVEGATTPSYVVYKDSSGYTCAKNMATSVVEFRDSNSRLVIQKAIDKMDGGTIRIQAGTYLLTSTIFTCRTSITGDGSSATILKPTSSLSTAVISVTNDYYKLDGTRAMSSSVRPTGITISNLQIDGSANYVLLRGILFKNVLNSNIVGVYVHDLTGGQGLYMSNSHYCTIKNSQVHDVGDNANSHYGAGIAFGEASSTRVACSYITIDNVRISKVSMCAIDLEPANHITITNCVFTEAGTWNGRPTCVIGLYPIAGYAANNFITVTGNKMTGAFGEFVHLVSSTNSVIKNNIITQTSGTTTSIYASSSPYVTISGNVIKTASPRAIVLIGCASSTVVSNTILR